MYKDKNGVEIREFSVLKFYHHTGKKRRKYYMYKWVKMKDGYLAGFHLNKTEGSFWLKAVAKDNIIECEVVQDYSTPYIDY